MNEILFRTSLSLTLAFSGWAAAYLGLDRFLQRVTLPTADQPAAEAGLRLRKAARPYRLAWLVVGGMVLGGQSYLLVTDGHSWSDLLAMFGWAVVDLTPVQLLWHFTLRKQFPCLRGYL